MESMQGNNSSNDTRQNVNKMTPSTLDDSDRSQSTKDSSTPAYNNAVMKFMTEEGYGAQVSLANLVDDEM